MNKLDAAIAGSDYITVTINGETYSVTESHPNYGRARDALKSQDVDLLLTLVDIPKAITKFSDGKVVVEGDEVLFLGKAIHNGLTRRMMEMMKEGFNIAPLAAFLENIQANPSHRAVNELYGFLEVCKLPITDDGHFLAYKRVRADFTDIYSGTVDNSPGKTPWMPRNEVDDDKDNTCSQGLHFCSIKYLPAFGTMRGKSNDNVIIVKVNPADVVSIPADYDNAKGRAWRYEVVDVWMDWKTYVDRNEERFTKPVVDTYTPPPPKGHSLLSFNDAANALCGHTQDPKSALKKRIRRGSVMSTVASGHTMYYVDDAVIWATKPTTSAAPGDQGDLSRDMTQAEKEETRAWKNGHSDGITAASKHISESTGGIDTYFTNEQLDNPGLYVAGFTVGYNNYTAELEGRLNNATQAAAASYQVQTNLGTGAPKVNSAEYAPTARPLTAEEESNTAAWKDGYEFGQLAVGLDIGENNVFQKGKHVRPSENTLYTRGFHKGYREAYDAWLKGTPPHVRDAIDAENKHKSTSWTMGISDGILDSRSDKASQRVKNSYKRPPDVADRKDHYVEAFKLAYERTWDNSNWNWFDGDR